MKIIAGRRAGGQKAMMDGDDDDDACLALLAESRQAINDLSLRSYKSNRSYLS